MTAMEAVPGSGFVPALIDRLPGRRQAGPEYPGTASVTGQLVEMTVRLADIRCSSLIRVRALAGLTQGGATTRDGGEECGQRLVTGGDRLSSAVASSKAGCVRGFQFPDARRTVARMVARHLHALLVACVLALAFAAPASAHDGRQIGEYEVVVGFIGEPAFTGEKSGLELVVTKGDTPIEGLETLTGGPSSTGTPKRDLPLSPTFGQAGASGIRPSCRTGPYTFHISGTIEEEPGRCVVHVELDGVRCGRGVDRRPVPHPVPSPGELAADARRGRDAAAQMPLALALGAAGLKHGPDRAGHRPRRTAPRGRVVENGLQP